MPKQAKKTNLIKPTGDVTSTIKEKLKEDILKKIAEGITDLQLDFSAVKIIDSTGVGVLVAACNSLKEKAGSLTVLNASADLKQMFKIMRLDQYIKFE